MKVRNMRSPRTGIEVANQFIIEYGGQTIFQSYDVIIAIKDGRKIVLDKNYWNYSKTTSKYRNEFTLSYLAVNQNLFVSDNLVNSLGTQEKLRLYTENRHRTVEIMEDYKSDFKTLIDTILKEYISGKSDYISENPSDIRIKISKTMHDFYQDDSVIQEPKDTTLRLLEKKRKL